MKRVINGKLYDTETAERICDISPIGFSSGDFQWEDTYLYRTPKGAFFLAGRGNARSRWARSVGQSGTESGEGVEPISDDDARAFVERHCHPEVYARLFGEPEAA